MPITNTKRLPYLCEETKKDLENVCRNFNKLLFRSLRLFNLFPIIVLHAYKIELSKNVMYF